MLLYAVPYRVTATGQKAPLVEGEPGPGWDAASKFTTLAEAEAFIAAHPGSIPADTVPIQVEEPDPTGP